MPNCDISGQGLKNALAGQPAVAQILCKDRYENPLSSDSLQGKSLSFGLALFPSSTQASTQASETHFRDLPCRVSTY